MEQGVRGVVTVRRTTASKAILPSDTNANGTLWHLTDGSLLLLSSLFLT